MLAALVAVAGGGEAFGELWAYEGFNYQPQSRVDENLENTGDPATLSKGFKQWEWPDNHNMGLVGDGLTYGTLLTHGGSLVSLTSPEDPFRQSIRALDVDLLPSFDSISEIWISFLIRRNHELGDFRDTAQLRLSYPTALPIRQFSLTLGERYQDNAQQSVDQLGFWSRGTGATAYSEPVNGATAPLGTAETKLVVFKLTLNVLANADLGEMFVNPILGQSTPGVEPVAQGTMDLQRWFERFAIESEIQNGGGEFVFDEFRMGSTYSDVTPTIPEPSSLLLIGTAGAALIGSRRRRKAA